jgi:hypothetical protein
VDGARTPGISFPIVRPPEAIFKTIGGMWEKVRAFAFSATSTAESSCQDMMALVFHSASLMWSETLTVVSDVP